MSANEYDAILQTNRPPVGNEYDELLRDQQENDTQVLRGTFEAASKVDPDRRARALQYAERTRLPADVVERNLDLVEQQDRVASNDYDGMLKSMPRTASWLMESPDNAAVARDDLDALGTFESLISGIVSPATATPNPFTDALSVGFSHGRETTQLGRLGFQLAQGNRDPAIFKQIETIERDLSNAPGGNGFSAQWVYPASKLIGQMLESGVKATETGLIGASTGAVAATIAGQLGPQILLPEEVVTVPAAAAGGFLAGLGAGYWADVYQVEAGHSYLELSRIRGKNGEEIPESTRRAAAVGVGLINAMLETTGARMVAAPFKAAAKKFITEGTKQAIVKPTVAAAAKNFAKAYATAVASEVTTEVMQETTSILLEETSKLSTDGDFNTLLNSPEERDAAIERLFAIASETFRGMALTGLPGATVNFAADVRNVRRARDNQEFFKSLGETAAQSKLRERLPAKLQEALDRITKDGPVENVYVPIGEWTTYFQQVGVDPRQIATEVLGDTRAYDEALQTGEDLKIPTARYAITLAASDYHRDLIPHLRLDPEQMTAAEADAFVESLKADSETEAAAGETVDGISETTPSVRDDVLGQLLGLGYERSTAEAYADLYESTFQTLGKRANVDPRALYQRYGLKIERPTPEALRQAGGVDALDVMIDRLRKGDVPSDRDIYGPSLVDFLVSRGGLQEDGGELAARDAKLSRRGLVSDKGLALDHAAEIAVEAGYLAERDPNRLLESIGSELKGDPVFARTRANSRLLDVRGALDELDLQLQQIGANVQTMDNTQIKRALQTGELPGGAVKEFTQRVREFFQGATARADNLAETFDEFIDRRSKERDAKVKEAGLVVGIRTPDGEVIAGEHGQMHFQLMMAYPRESLEAEFGFVDKDGKFYTRGEAITAFRVHDSTQLAREYDQPVYHGSPHLFDKFSLQQIGAGEGNQSYGWGLYFAGRKEVAQYYREALSQEVITVDGKEISNEEFSQLPSYERTALSTVSAQGIERTLKRLEEMREEVADQSWLDQYEGAVRALEGKEVKRKTKGNLYTVEIPEDSEFLDWDKPLSQQPKKILAALRKIDVGDIPEQLQAFELRSSTGRSIYMALQRGLTNDRKDAPRAASEYLASLGIAGIKYLDADSRDQGDGTSNYVVFDDQLVKILELEQRNDDTKRGSIRIGADRQISIRILERANLSTFLHETGHFYLEVLGDLATGELATGQAIAGDLAQDYQALLDWFGVQSREEITTEHHEQFARGFEAYLRDGKAPSANLRTVFAKFRAWLVAIYRNLAQLNVELTPQVRDVMDRLLATEEEIAAAEREGEVVPLFSDAASAGMTEPEYAAYRKTAEAASLAARDKLQARLLAEARRTQERWWKDARGQVRTEIAAEVDAQPEQQAAALLARGTQPDGSALAEGVRPFKIDRKLVVDVYGADFAKRIPRQMLTREGGVAPDQAAEALGYPSGEQLLLAMANLHNRDQLIDAETDARMRERYGDLLLDGSALSAAAQQAVEGPERAKVIGAEIAALRRKAREVRPFVQAERQQQTARRREGMATLRGTQLPLGQIQAMAAGMIAQKRVRDVNPGSYLIAIRRAAKAAVEAAGKGDYETAAAAKQRELLNLELYRAATEAREEMDTIAERMKRYDKTKTRERIGKAGADYLEQIDALLDRFDFKRISNRAIDKRQALAEWIAKKQAAGETLGEELSIPPTLINETNRTNYRNLTVEELRGLRDAVSQIEHFARLKNKLLAASVAAERDDARADLITAMETNLKDRGPPPISKSGLSAAQRLGARAAAFDASLLKMEQLVDWLDGGKIDGPWHRYLWDGASDAQAAELDYSAKITQRLAHAVMNVPKEIRQRMRERITINGIDRVMTRKDIISIALNVGNDSNYQKLLAGMGWTEEQVEQMLSRLTKSEWEFVQSVWDTLESLWPDTAKLQKELTGLEPEKIAARPVPTRFGTYQGGYYPVMYDPLASEQGQLQLASRVGGLLEDTYTRATTPKGHTKSRIEGFARPFDLDFDNLPGHIAGVIKDLTHRKWLLDASWVVNDREIRASLRRHLGDEYVNLFPDWVRSVVNDRNFASLRSLGIWRRAIEQLRYNVMIAAMGFKATTMLTQIAGAGPAVEVIGGKEGDGVKYYRRGLGQFIRRPLATYEYVTGLSGEMRHRLETRDRDLRDKLRLLQGRDDFLAKVQDFAMRGIVYTEMTVSVPAWLGAYQKALDQGYDQETAIRAGDRAVRLSQGAGGAKDLAGVMARNDTFMRTITMFYTPFNALYNRMRDIGHSIDGIRDVPQAAMRLWWVWLVPAVLGEFLSGRGPGEDDDGEWWLRTILLYPTLAIPFLRDIAGGMFGEFGYQLSPVAQLGETLARTTSKAGKVIAGDANIEDLAKPALRTAGYLLGIPSGQAEITGSYLYDLAQGKDPEDLGEFARNLLFRRPKE